MNRVKRWVAGLAALSILVLAGCAATASSPAGPDIVKVAAVAAGPFTRQFNPLLLGSQNASGYSKPIFEPLLMDDFIKGENKPWLVTSFTWSPDGKALTLNIRHGVKWSDGTPLTGEDVAFTFELMRRFPGLNTNGLQLAGASAPDPTKAVIAFTQPAFQVMWWRTSPVPKHLWENVKDPVTYQNTEPVGTGPYRLKTFSAQVITLEKNPYYWQSNAPKIQTLQYLSYESDASMIAALQSGQVDYITPSTADPASIAARAPSKIGYWVTKPNTSMVFLMPNNDVYPASDPPVRKAIGQALDRPAISKLALGGQNEPAVSPIGLDVTARADSIAANYRDLRYGAADPAAAKATLTAAGYKLGSDGVFVTRKGTSLSLQLMVPLTNPYGDWVRASQVIANQLAAAGIKIEVKTESQTAWRSDVDRGNYQLTMRAIGGTLSVYDLFDRIFSQELIAPVGKKALRNYERYRNPEAGLLLTGYANAAPGSPAESAALAGLQRLMIDDVPMVPLFFTAGVGMWRIDRFTGWPSANDPYAVSIGNGPNTELILLRLTRKR